ncbi:M23 family metallopeptidase [Staphylococcus canis]|uniref:lysostaphin n=1 Tax=Staphylococcus canis TaxID=2724942 RepID=A0ABS0TAH9_9STAP|nr:M23 family metallopeptidase [Staphylococcus canis]MBI5975743.1 M23 family metallopeptidase [Staphylococcus canis]
MKKITTATIATLGLVTAGFAIHGEADAAEQTQSQTITSYETHYSEATQEYITIDNLGNRHHTLDGNWDPSMFENHAYYTEYIDDGGYRHYIYYPTDNDYSISQSHESIQANGYQGYIGPNDDIILYDDVNNGSDYNTNANASANWSTNSTDQTGNMNGGAVNAPAMNAPQASDSTVTPASTQATGSAGWLNNYPQWQPYGHYHGGGAHYGVDYGMPVGTPVYSFTNGRVIDSGWSNYGGGNQITIQEAGTNNYQWYMHLSQLNVSRGDTVTEGQQIGLSGNTGNSTGPHLHFQRMSGGIGNGYAVDPTGYLASK